MKNRRWAILILYFLSPITAELLSGSAPPEVFFNPFSLYVLPALYGSGALIIRDLARRWHKGWISIVLMGMAFGIYEEGVVVRSFFDPTWPDLGEAGLYGRWMGVNWVWALGLIWYHAIVSITIPILLVELLYPKWRDETWLRIPGWIIFPILCLSTAAFGPLVGMRASLLDLWASVAAMAVLVTLAYVWPTYDPPRVQPVRPVGALWMILAGFFGMLIYPVVFWGLASARAPLPLIYGLGLLAPPLAGGVAWALGGRSWTDRHRWAYAAGGLLVWNSLAFGQAFGLIPNPDGTGGMWFVGVMYLVFLIGLGIAIWRRTGRPSVLPAGDVSGSFSTPGG